MLWGQPGGVKLQVPSAISLLATCYDCRVSPKDPSSWQTVTISHSKPGAEVMATWLEEHLAHTDSPPGFEKATASGFQVQGLSKNQSQLVLTHTQFLRGTLQGTLGDFTPNSKCPVIIPSLWQKRKECEARPGSQVPRPLPW